LFSLFLINVIFGVLIASALPILLKQKTKTSKMIFNKYWTNGSYISFYMYFIFSYPFWCFFFTLSRRVLIYPKGNCTKDYLSMYLVLTDSAYLPNGWSSYAQFSLTIVNQINNKYSVRKGSLFSLFRTVATKWTTMHAC
jgi:hypothetical protein